MKMTRDLGRASHGARLVAQGDALANWKLIPPFAAADSGASGM